MAKETLTIKRKLRCAVYTRKSSEEGLELEFNSLHAQREACEAYVASQRAEGWLLLSDRYDDGGFSGGTLGRVSGQRPERRLLVGFIQPCIASEATKVPTAPGWVHDIKHDGDRMQVRKVGDRVRLWTRQGFNWTEHYPRIVAFNTDEGWSCDVTEDIASAVKEVAQSEGRELRDGARELVTRFDEDVAV